MVQAEIAALDAQVNSLQKQLEQSVLESVNQKAQIAALARLSDGAAVAASPLGCDALAAQDSPVAEVTSQCRHDFWQLDATACPEVCPAGGHEHLLYRLLCAAILHGLHCNGRLACARPPCLSVLSDGSRPQRVQLPVFPPRQDGRYPLDLEAATVVADIAAAVRRHWASAHHAGRVPAPQP